MKSKQDSNNSKENRSAAEHTTKGESSQSMDGELMMFEPPDLGLNEAVPVQKVAMPPVSFHPPVVQREIDMKAFESTVKGIIQGAVFNPNDGKIKEAVQYIAKNINESETSVMPMFYQLFISADALDRCYREHTGKATIQEKIDALKSLNSIIADQVGGNVLVGDDLVNMADGNDDLSRYFKMGLNAVIDIWPTIEDDGMKNKYANKNLQNSKDTYSRRVKLASEHPEAPALLKKMTSMLTVNFEKQASSSVDVTLGLMLEEFGDHVKRKNIKNPTEKDCYNFCMKMAADQPDLVADLNMDQFKEALLKMADMSYGPL